MKILVSRVSNVAIGLREGGCSGAILVEGETAPVGASVLRVRLENAKPTYSRFKESRRIDR